MQAIDVSNALEAMLNDDSTAGETYELYGPKNYSVAEIAELVDREIIKHRRHINLPKIILKPAAHYLNKLLWWEVLSGDQVEREFIDQVIDPTAKTFKDLGIEPAELSDLTFHYLVRHGKIRKQDGHGMANCFHRKGTAALHIMIYPLRQSRKRRRRGSICTLLKTCSFDICVVLTLELLCCVYIMMNPSIDSCATLIVQLYVIGYVRCWEQESRFLQRVDSNRIPHQQLSRPRRRLVSGVVFFRRVPVFLRFHFFQLRIKILRTVAN